ncbi:choice-of-anchor Q domain-containing protein [Tenacibaculum sp.]|uniref:choice-of-anchor Q domain-containing protein n=1 Tax=Tenacibaculum sp. TaxID=1906242 RepID=UPI003D13F172
MTYYQYNGGAIGCAAGEYGANVTLDNVIISENYSTSSGTAGVYIAGVFNANNCTFQNNTQTSASNAIALHLYLDGDYTKKARNIINCTFYNNTSTNAGATAVMVDRTGANFINNTFINNTNGIKAYAMDNIGSEPELNIVNCILANSTGYDLYSYSGDDLGTKCTNSIIEVEETGGNVVNYVNSYTGDQTLLNVTSPTSNGGDATLTPYIALANNSVAINTGVAGNFGSVESGGIVAVPLTDQRGFSRVGITDIGAYEYEVPLTNNAPKFTAPNTGFDVASTSYTGNSFNVSSQISSPYGIAFSNDGTRMFVSTYDKKVVSYTLTTPYAISTASFVTSLNLSYRSAGINFNNDGTKFYHTGNSSAGISEYNLSTPYDLSTATVNQRITPAQGSDYNDVTFNNDGTKMYLLAYNGGYIYEYTLIFLQQRIPIIRTQLQKILAQRI